MTTCDARQVKKPGEAGKMRQRVRCMAGEEGRIHDRLNT